jgi:twinkle protein
MKTWSDFGIQIEPGASGHTRTTCPSCSPDRRKASAKCLSVEIGEGIAYCHHCGKSFSLNGRDHESVVIYFARPVYKPTDLPSTIQDRFAKRGIPKSILEMNQIGYGKRYFNKVEKAVIQFPYIKDGQTVNIKHRAENKEFQQEKNAEKCLYRFDEISKLEGETLIITEGEIDALSVQTAGFNMVSSIPDGAPSADAKSFATKFDFLKSAEVIIQGYPKVILAMDNDAPGKLAERELARRIGAEKCYRVEYPAGCKDANDVLVKYGKDRLKQVIELATPFPVEGLFSAGDFKCELENLYDCGDQRGLSTGWLTVDELYTVRSHEFTVVTGIPSHGKSNFVDALAVNLMENHGWKFLFFSPENWPVEKHIQSLIEKVSQKPFSKRHSNIDRLTKAESLEHLEDIKQFMFFLYPDEGTPTLDQVLEKARAAVFRYGVNGVVIDPWNELDHQYENMTEAQYLSKQLSKIRQFARRNGVHIWLVAHPRNLIKDKDGSYKPPTMYEISGGAHWRNKADNGICLYRANFENDITTLFVQKIRFKETGKIGNVDLKYIRDNGRYI